MAVYIDRDGFIEDIKTEITNLKMDGLKGTPRPYDEFVEFIDRINEQPICDVVSSAAYGQVLWERDLALKQLREDYGVGLGEKKKDEECIWVITVMEKVEPSDKYYVLFGDKRTWGYYKEYDTALQALHENCTDICEGCYDYAVLEKFPESICPVCEERYWFKYDRGRNGYFEIEEPECVKDTWNFAMG